MGPPKKLRKNTRFYKTFRHIGDDVKRHASGDETAGSVYIRSWCKSSVKAVHVKLLHKMLREDKKLKSRVDLSSLPRTSLLFSHTSSMWTTGLLRACTRSNRGGWRLIWESWNHCDHVVLSCQPRRLISWMQVIGKEMSICWSWRIPWQLWVSMKVMIYE